MSRNLPGEWRMHNICLAYIDQASNKTMAQDHRHWYYKLALFRPSGTQAAAPLSFKSWPSLFVEGTGSTALPGLLVGEQSRAAHHRTHQQRQRVAHEAERWPRTWHDGEALVTALTMDNLWHSVYHALPVSEYATRLASARAHTCSLTVHRATSQWTSPLFGCTCRCTSFASRRDIMALVPAIPRIFRQRLAVGRLADAGAKPAASTISP